MLTLRVRCVPPTRWKCKHKNMHCWGINLTAHDDATTEGLEKRHLWLCGEEVEEMRCRQNSGHLRPLRNRLTIKLAGGSHSNNLNCRCSADKAPRRIFKLVGHYSFLGVGECDDLLLRLWLEGGHGRINLDSDERYLSVIVQRHPDSIQARKCSEVLRILYEIGHAVLPRETRPY